MGTIALETGTLIYALTLMTKHAHIFFIRLYFDMNLRCAPNLVQNCHHQPGEVPHQSPKEPEPPAAAIEYTDGDILPALPETMSIRERRPSLMRSPIPGRSWEVQSFYDITPHPR